MKKHGLLKSLGILLVLVMIASFTIKGRQDIIDYLGIGEVFINYYSIVLQNFCNVILFVLAVGGFYGVLNKIPAYKKLLDNIVTRVKPLNKKFIFLTILLFAVISSLTGMTLQLIIFIPFVTSIILLLGYDKLVAISSTVVSMLVGYTGGVLVNIINPNTAEVTTFEKFIGLEKAFSNTFPKILLLLAGVALLIYFVNNHIKSVEEKKVKYELNDDSEIMIHEVKGNYKDIKTWPIVVILSLMFIILTLGIVPWNGLFEIKVFTEFNTWLNELAIKDFAIIPNIISENLPAFGEWNTTGNPMTQYTFISIMILFFTLILALVNRMNFNEALDNFLEGMKKTLPAAILISIAFNILVCAYNNGFLETIISDYGKFNYGVSSLLIAVACILNVDTTWIILGGITPVVNLITDESVYASVAILIQGIQGIVSIVGPTSLILIFGLSYLDIPYTTYLKYIWRFVLSLIILLALVTMLVVLL